jgi:hypothetical protein
VGKDSLTVCRRVPGPWRRRLAETRTFRTTTGSLRLMRDWLVEEGVTVAAMESTSTYWKPPFYCLDEVMEVWLLNAAHMKAVPGRKSDVRDAEWIAQLLEAGDQVKPGDLRWNYRRVPSPGTHLAFGVTSMTSELVREAFGTWVQLRHSELNEAAPEPFGVTVGVLLSRRTDGVRDWDTRMVALVGPIDPDTLQIWQRVWPGDTAPQPSGPAADDAT